MASKSAEKPVRVRLQYKRNEAELLLHSDVARHLLADLAAFKTGRSCVPDFTGEDFFDMPFRVSLSTAIAGHVVYDDTEVSETPTPEVSEEEQALASIVWRLNTDVRLNDQEQHAMLRAFRTIESEHLRLIAAFVILRHYLMHQFTHWVSEGRLSEPLASLLSCCEAVAPNPHEVRLTDAEAFGRIRDRMSDIFVKLL